MHGPRRRRRGRQHTILTVLEAREALPAGGVEGSKGLSRGCHGRGRGHCDYPRGRSYGCCSCCCCCCSSSCYPRSYRRSPPRRVKNQDTPAVCWGGGFPPLYEPAAHAANRHVSSPSRDRVAPVASFVVRVRRAGGACSSACSGTGTEQGREGRGRW
jgi:hypothetical protein